MERCKSFFGAAHEGIVDPRAIGGAEDMVMDWVIVRMPVINGNLAVETGDGIGVPVAMVEAYWGISCYSRTL